VAILICTSCTWWHNSLILLACSLSFQYFLKKNKIYFNTIACCHRNWLHDFLNVSIFLFLFLLLFLFLYMLIFSRFDFMFDFPIMCSISDFADYFTLFWQSVLLFLVFVVSPFCWLCTCFLFVTFYYFALIIYPLIFDYLFFLTNLAFNFLYLEPIGSLRSFVRIRVGYNFLGTMFHWHFFSSIITLLISIFYSIFLNYDNDANNFSFSPQLSSH